jgi:hypothetical protein
MLDMFSFEDMLNVFVEGEDEPHLGNKELPKEQKKTKKFST